MKERQWRPKMLQYLTQAVASGVRMAMHVIAASRGRRTLMAFHAF